MPYTLNDLRYLMRRLRDAETGCPWDIQQDFNSITSSTIEEAYEVVDAIENGERSQVREELGDLLFQIIFYSQLADEEGCFTLDDVIDGLTTKLIRRHPHVFPDGTLNSVRQEADVAVDVKAQWEAIKSQERQDKGLTALLADIPVRMPALTRAYKIQKRAASVGYDWPSLAPLFDTLIDELGELREAVASNSSAAITDELGDLLFTVVNISRHLKREPESVLRGANAKFVARINTAASLAQQKNVNLKDLSEVELDALWEQAKALLRTS